MLIQLQAVIPKETVQLNHEANFQYFLRNLQRKNITNQLAYHNNFGTIMQIKSIGI